MVTRDDFMRMSNSGCVVVLYDAIVELQRQINDGHAADTLRHAVCENAKAISMTRSQLQNLSDRITPQPKPNDVQALLKRAIELDAERNKLMEMVIDACKPQPQHDWLK